MYCCFVTCYCECKVTALLHTGQNEENKEIIFIPTKQFGLGVRIHRGFTNECQAMNNFFQ